MNTSGRTLECESSVPRRAVSVSCTPRSPQSASSTDLASARSDASVRRVRPGSPWRISPVPEPCSNKPSGDEDKPPNMFRTRISMPTYYLLRVRIDRGVLVVHPCDVSPQKPQYAHGAKLRRVRAGSRLQAARSFEQVIRSELLKAEKKRGRTTAASHPH